MLVTFPPHQDVPTWISSYSISIFCKGHAQHKLGLLLFLQNHNTQIILMFGTDHHLFSMYPYKYTWTSHLRMSLLNLCLCMKLYCFMVQCWHTGDLPQTAPASWPACLSPGSRNTDVTCRRWRQCCCLWGGSLQQTPTRWSSRPKHMKQNNKSGMRGTGSVWISAH